MGYDKYIKVGERNMIYLLVKGKDQGLVNVFIGCRELIFKNLDLINCIIEFILFYGLIYEMLMKFLD